MASPANGLGHTTGATEEHVTDKTELTPRSTFKTSNFNGHDVKKGNFISNIFNTLGRIACIRRDTYKPIK